jgi:hypothetical protein
MPMLSTRSGRSRILVGTALVAALAVGGLLGSSFTQRSEAAAQPVMNFTGGSALLMNYVNSGKTSDFERVMQAYGDALAGSDNAQYNQMASGLKVYRAAEPGQNNTVLYLWYLDNVVSGANYAVANVLNDEMPEEVQGLYEALVASLEGGGQLPMNMDLLMEF